MKDSEKLIDFDICPVSGLKVRTSEEWCDIILSNRYSASFAKIGENILFSIPVGKADSESMALYIEKRKQFKIAFDLEGKKFFEIKDYRFVYGYPDNQTRHVFTEFMLQEESDFLGYFGFGCNFFIKSVFNLGARKYRYDFPVIMLKSYMDCVQYIFSEQSKVEGRVSPTYTWKLSNERVHIDIDVLERNILYSRGHGLLNKADILEVLRLQNEALGVIKDKLNCDHVYKITDLSKIKQADFLTRKAYADGINAQQRILPCKQSYILGENIIGRLALYVGKMLVSFPVKFAKDFDEALQDIHELGNPHDEDSEEEVRRSVSVDINALLKFLGDVAWDIEGLEQFSNRGADDPLNPVLEALSVIKMDIDSHIAEKKEKEQQLRDALARAESATKAKSEFLATVSHEIRTPMNGILGMSNLLLETELKDEQQHYAEIVRNSANSLLNVINDILDFSKIESGKLDLEFIPCDLMKILEECFDVIVFKAKEKGLDFYCKAPCNYKLDTISDPGRIRQVILNLLGNAVKFTDSGYVCLNLNIIQKENLSYFEISILDSGIGIEKEDSDKLFKRFSQVDASTTRKFGGTGLGLSISKKLVDMLGGAIQHKPNIPQGSVFTFSIPVEGDLKVKADRPLKNKRILVVSEDSFYLPFVEQCLIGADAGYQIIDRNEFRENTEQYSSNLDLIIYLDKAPKKKDIRKYFKDKKVPILLCNCQSYANEFPAGQSKEIHVGFPIKQSLFSHTVLAALNVQSGEAETIIDEGAILDFSSSQYQVLLVDDNTVNLKVAKKMLEKYGLTVQCAQNGLEAVQAFQKESLDAIFMDCQMPELDGYEATGRIRSIEEDSRIPIVAMTANAMKGDKEKCLNAGMDDYVSKPIQKPELERILDKWLNKKGE